MARGCIRCPSPRGCHDFSSRCEQAPSLADIHVVGKILRQAATNTLARWQEFQAGSRTGESLREADLKLIDWLTATFSGNNPHFRTDEAWNPDGLAAYLQEVFEGNLGDENGVVPEEPRAIIHAAARQFLHDLYVALDDESGAAMSGVLSRWEMILSGAPC